jgi:hypothetical protein
MFTRIASIFIVITVCTLVVISALGAPATQITYPEKTFANGKARFFSYKSDAGVTIRYFIMKSSDGVIRAAFDAGGFYGL